MAATMKDLARHTGLGLATISSYFNGGNVREKNRIKIEQAIEELHYEVNEVARGLKTNATHTIGVVIPELNNTFCTEIITGMEDNLRSRGYATIVCDCRTDAALEQEAIEFLTRKRVDGIINMPVDPAGSGLREFSKAGKPVILLDRRIQGLDCDCVLVDNRRAVNEAASLLFAQGHRNIGIISGPREIYTASERLKGYADAHKEAGIPVQESLICQGDYTIRGGVSGMISLIRRNPHMTAVIATNYEMTVGMMIAVNELGIRIPDELSLIGFDNLEFARACCPALSIVSQPTMEMAKETASLMLARLGVEGEASSGPEVKYLRTRLIGGRSVSGPLPGAEERKAVGGL